MVHTAGDQQKRQIALVAGQKEGAKSLEMPTP